MSNEIQLYSKLQNPIEAIDRIGEMFAKSGMFGCDRPEQGKILALICLAENKSPVAIVRDYHLIDGKLSKKALAALADFRKGGGKHKWIVSGDAPATNPEDQYAEIEVKPTDGDPVRYRYSMADAKAEGLIRKDSRWTKRPGNMLRARCISNALGMVAPELYAGEDDVDDTPATPTAQMNLGTGGPKTATVSTSAVATETATPGSSDKAARAVVVEAEVVTEEKELAKMGLAPVTPTPEVTPQSLLLDKETLEKLEAAIGEHKTAALQWLTKEGWLTDVQSLAHLTKARAESILKKKEKFIAKITEAKPAQ